MTPDLRVQTPPEAQSAPDPYRSQDQGAAVCLRSPRGGKLRVMRSDAAIDLLKAGWEVEEDVTLQGACECGCGISVPWDYDDAGHLVRLQKYADPENCRRALYALMHPTLDLSGMHPDKAKHAARMAEEAVKAAKLGQARATVDASRPVTHKNADTPDPRPSNRLRLSQAGWERLGEIKALGFYGGLSYSAIAEQLIEQEVELCRARARQEEEQDGQA